MYRKQKAAFLKSLEPTMKVGKVDGQIFYDPKTGVYIPARRIPPCPGGHSLTELYWNPCLECAKFCNCNHTHWFPDIVVKTSDNDTIRVSSVVVAGSSELVGRLNEVCCSTKRTLMKDLIEAKNGWATVSKGDDKKEIEVMDVSSEEEEDVTLDEAGLSGEDKPVGAEIGADLSPDFKELIEFPPELPAFKVKDENWRMLGLTTFEWRWIEKFMALHRDQVEEDIEEEKRAREYFRLSMFARPEKDVINPWRYHDWEEDLFANLSHTELFGIVRAVHELMIFDLYIPLAKWLTLLRGIPRVADFGLGHWLTELSPEMWDSGLEEFCEGAIRPMWDYGSPQMFSLHKDIPRRQRPRSTLLWRKRIWKAVPQFSTRWWNP